MVWIFNCLCIGLWSITFWLRSNCIRACFLCVETFVYYSCEYLRWAHNLLPLFPFLSRSCNGKTPAAHQQPQPENRSDHLSHGSYNTEGHISLEQFCMHIYSFFNRWLFDCKNLSVLWMMMRLLQFEGTAHRHCLTLLKHFPTPLYFFLVGNLVQTGFKYVNFKVCKHGPLA